MKPFCDVLEPARLGATTFRLAVEDGWQQGRGAYGGLVVGAMVRAAMLTVDDPARRVRSVNAELLAPVPVGPSILEVETVRTSSALAVVRVVLRAEAEGDGAAPLFTATVLCARDREGTPSWAFGTPPPMPAVEALPVVPPLPGLMPIFTQHFEYRTVGPAPYAGTEPRAEGYVRPRNPGPRVDAAMLAALADCYWPAAFGRLEAPRPIATIAYALSVVDDRLGSDARIYHRAFCNHIGGGYAHETRELWSPDGRLLATNQQVIAIIR
jgi:acyl-CoA thioesterase